MYNTKNYEENKVMITEQTLSILKNFATINPNIVINEGNVIKTISEAKTILCKSTLDVTFPQTFGIFDLNEFLSAVSLVEKPNLLFSDDYVIISDQVGRTKIKYYFSDPDILTSPSKDVVMKEPEVEFVLEKEVLSKVRRAASVLGHEFLNISCINKSLWLSVNDTTDVTSNAYMVEVNGTYPEENFNFVFKINNLKMVEGDYKVSISSKLISHFVNVNSGNLSLDYWVALEKTSTYGE